MYVPRNLFAHLFTNLIKSHNVSSSPVLILVAVEPDALCACHMLTHLFKFNFIRHSITPIAGYGDLARVGEKLVRPLRTTDGGTGGTVICLGVGGLVDLEAHFGLEPDEDGNGGGMGGVDVWIMDARRPYNLSNVFGLQSTDGGELVPGVARGEISARYKSGVGGVFVFDDGDIAQELGKERDAYCALAEMPELGEDLESEDESDEEIIPSSQRENEEGDEAEDEDTSVVAGEKRKRQSPAIQDSDPDEGTPSKRRRSNSSSPVPVTPSKQPSAKSLRKKLLGLQRKHNDVLQAYYNLGASYSEPVSSLMWDLASKLANYDNDMLWLAIVGVSSYEISGKTSSGIGLSPESGASNWSRDRIKFLLEVLRGEVRRLNPTDLKDLLARDVESGVIQTHAKNPSDMAIRISPEPRLLLVRHWSLYESMVHSPYLSVKLHIWNESGRRKLHKLLAKMGVSLTQCKQSYTHMDMEIRRSLRQQLLKHAPIYGLEALVPPDRQKDSWGFVRCWGYKACFSAMDVGVIVGAILEVGDMNREFLDSRVPPTSTHSGISTPKTSLEPTHRIVPTHVELANYDPEESLHKRFWTAYDALSNVAKLTEHIPTAQHLYRAILRTGASIIEKRQVKPLAGAPIHLVILKDGPDIALFTHPGALIKLALWLAEVISEAESFSAAKGKDMILASLDEQRGIYTVVGLGGGSAVAAHKVRVARRVERKKEREQRKTEKEAVKEKKRRLRRERLAVLGEDSDLEDDESESDGTESEQSSDGEEDEVADRGEGLNWFGNAFQQAIEETGVRVKADSFEHCVVEVKKDDLLSFLERACTIMRLQLSRTKA
jgi:cell division control protein 45